MGFEHNFLKHYDIHAVIMIQFIWYHAGQTDSAVVLHSFVLKKEELIIHF